MKLIDEFREKIDRVRSMLQREALAGVMLKRQSNFSWITCGGQANVSMASEIARASILITPAKICLIASNIELERVLKEEIRTLTKEMDVEEYAWNQKSDSEVANSIMQGKKWGSDVPCRSARTVTGPVLAIRTPLHPGEILRYRGVGKDLATVLTAVAQAIKPGMTELEIAGMMAQSLIAKEIMPAALLVAADDRIKKYRHPIPKANKARKRVMLIANVKRHGLHASATRTVCFGKPPAQLVDRHASCCRIEAAAMATARPETAMGKILQAMVAAYDAEGYADEWRNHHQGGPIGYDGRDLILTVPGLKAPVQDGQAFAMNPTISGAKSEDTFIARTKGPEIITVDSKWPTIECETAVGVIKRPAMLIR